VTAASCCRAGFYRRVNFAVYVGPARGGHPFSRPRAAGVVGQATSSSAGEPQRAGTARPLFATKPPTTPFTVDPIVLPSTVLPYPRGWSTCTPRAPRSARSPGVPRGPGAHPARLNRSARRGPRPCFPGRTLWAIAYSRGAGFWDRPRDSGTRSQAGYSGAGIDGRPVAGDACSCPLAFRGPASSRTNLLRRLSCGAARRANSPGLGAPACSDWADRSRKVYRVRAPRSWSWLQKKAALKQVAVSSAPVMHGRPSSRHSGSQDRRRWLLGLAAAVAVSSCHD